MKDKKGEKRIISIRKEKVLKLIEHGINPYAYRFDRTFAIEDILMKFKEADSFPEEELKIAGRIISIRLMGKASFFHVQDESGKIQCYITKNDTKEFYEIFKKLIDVGDIVGITGELFKTKTGELTVRVNKFEVLTKSTRPLPEKWHGLRDIEKRYRYRYLDMIANPDVKNIFATRAKIITSIRRFLEMNGFIEVETPILQTVASGATAKPFITHYNALDLNVYLRIAPELYLKRLLIGGFEKVYELGRNFRNEGMDSQHNPEFTMVEFYKAYSDYEDMMKLTEELFDFLLKQVFGPETKEIIYQGKRVSFKRPWKRATFLGLISEATGLEEEEILKDEEKVKKACIEADIDNANNIPHFKRVQELFDKLVEPHIVNPTFILDYPKQVSPLAKNKRDNPDLVERFELIICGKEVANAYSELNDPEEQLRRFKQQIEQKAKGDEEAMEIDIEFINALEYGMPPAAGEGIGIDRLTMILTNSGSIRDVLLFPQMRPIKDELCTDDICEVEE